MKFSRAVNLSGRVLLVGGILAGAVTAQTWWSHRSAAQQAHGHPASAATAQSPLTVRFQAVSPAVTAIAKPWLQLVNTSGSAIPLQRVTLRYYFHEAPNAVYEFNCAEAAVGCSNISGTINTAAAPTPDADHYLQISFTAAAGNLGKAANSGSIELELYRPDGAKLDQSNDRSFVAADAAAYAPSKMVTAYLGGRLVWGEEPGGATPAPSASGTGSSAALAGSPSAAPSGEPGVLFDDFHYSGPTDPALWAHGWLVRSGAGGPGIQDTWSPSGVSFPSNSAAVGGEVLQLQASSNGTKAGTVQSELVTASTAFENGTYAARIYYAGAPVSGRNGDHINESFYAISPYGNPYSELDTEYMPNGGWGAPGPELDTTTWYNPKAGDRITRRDHKTELVGWHTIVITVENGTVTYYVDGRKQYSTSGRYYPHVGMAINFNTWFVDLPFSGSRTWAMQVNWFYYNSGSAMTTDQITQAAAGYAAGGQNYVNTLSHH